MDSFFKICKTREDFVNYQRTHRLHAFKGHNKDYRGSGEIQQDDSTTFKICICKFTFPFSH